MLVQLEFILEVQAISFFLNINILITVSIIHMSAWVLHEVYKYITYPWHWHSNSKFVQSCRLNWLSSQTNLTSSTTSWIIYEDNKPTFAILILHNEQHQFKTYSVLEIRKKKILTSDYKKMKVGCSEIFYQPLVKIKPHCTMQFLYAWNMSPKYSNNTSEEKLTARELNRQSLKNILSFFFIMSAWKITLLQLLRVIFWYLFKNKKKTSDYNMYKEISKYD